MTDSDWRLVEAVAHAVKGIALIGLGLIILIYANTRRRK